MSLVICLLAGPFAVAFDADLAPFLEKRSNPIDPDAVPEIKPVDPKAPFPKLPPVEAMLNTSSHTVSEIVQEVTRIQARVHSVEHQDQEKLAEKKAEFESQLKGQEQDTRDVIAENAAIVTRINALQKGNQALREASKNLQAENDGMRAELRSAAKKVTAAGEFIKASEKSTDDRRSKVLAVLAEGVKHQRRQLVVPVNTDGDDSDDDASESQNEDAPTTVADSNDSADAAPTDEKAKGLVHIFGHRSKAKGKGEDKDTEKKKDDDDDDDEDADDDQQDDKDAAESFMQMRTEEGESEDMEESDSEEATAEVRDVSTSPFDGHRHGLHHKNKSPADAAVDGASRSMLQSVSQELKDLAAEDEQGLERQTEMFHSQLAQEHRAYKAALVQQRSLNKTEASLLTLQSKLHRAVSHLQGTKQHLQQRVRGVGQYLQHLAHLLLAPDKEAAGLIDSMPQDVPIPDPAPVVAQPANTLSAGASASLLQHIATQMNKK
jgi:hypothetical protein